MPKGWIKISDHRAAVAAMCETKDNRNEIIKNLEAQYKSLKDACDHIEKENQELVAFNAKYRDEVNKLNADIRHYETQIELITGILSFRNYTR